MNRRAAARGLLPACGLSLIEVLVVVAVIATLAAIALPNFAALDANRLDVAAGEVANALRFARSEAIRRGSQTGLTGTRLVAFNAVTSTHHIQVADYSGYALVALWDHPTEHKPYDVDLFNGLQTQGVTIASASFKSASNTISQVGFTQDGSPVTFVGYSGFGASFPLTSGVVQLSYAGHSRQVLLDPTGRVTIGPLL